MTDSLKPAGPGTNSGIGIDCLNLHRDQLAELIEVSLAVAGGTGAVWAPYHGPDGWVWAAQEANRIDASLWSTLVNTSLSPKAAMLPQTEELFAWQARQNDLRIVPSAEDGRGGSDGQGGPAGPNGIQPPPAVLFGVRPCDAAALEVLDQALLEGPWPEESYARRRAGALVVTWACSATGPQCFCDACGLSPAAEAGDVMILPPPAGELAEGGSASSGPVAGSESVLMVRGLTGRGREAVARLGALLQQRGGVAYATAADYVARREQLAAQRTAFGGQVDLLAVPGATEADSLDLFNSPAWAGIAERCISCGACAYVCPTCHCFAVSDEAGFETGRRVRTWDSCQFKEYMVAAGGHNPRPTKTERVRQRFMHKLSYHRVRHGRLMCVGCGRCAQACPVGLHVAEAAARLIEATQDREAKRV